jgi:hypothetical protein
MAEPFERFEDPNADHRGDHARAMREMAKLEKELTKAPPPAADPPARVPESPLRRHRKERLGGAGSVHELRKLYGRKSLDTGQGDGIDLNAVVVGHDLDAVAQGLGEGLRRRLADEREGLAIEAGKQVERAMSRTVEELTAEWGRQLAEAVAGVRRELTEQVEELRTELDARGHQLHQALMEVEGRLDRELPTLREAVEEVEAYQRTFVARVIDRLTEPPQVILPEGSIKVEHKTLLEQAPRKSTVTRSIVYDPQSGRPSKVIEEQEES